MVIYVCKGLCPHGFDPLQQSLTNLTQRRTVLLETGSLGISSVLDTYILYIHTYIHALYIYKHACVHTYIHTYIHTYTHTFMHTYIHPYIYTCKHYINTYIQTYIHKCKL